MAKSGKSEKDFFGVSLGILKYSGVWMPEKVQGTLRRSGCILMNAVFAGYLVFYTVAEMMYLRTTYVKSNLLIKNLNSAFSHLLGIYKGYIWITSKKDLKEIMRVLQSPELSFEEYEDFKPQEIVKEEKNLADKCGKTFFIMCVVFTFLAGITFLLTSIAAYENSLQSVTDVNNVTKLIYIQKLPYDSWIPWDYRSARWKFMLAAVSQWWGMLHFAFVIVGMDALFASSCSRITAQQRIIAGAFRTIRTRSMSELKLPPAEVLYDSKQLDVEMHKELKRCCLNLQTVYNVCNKVESIFTYLVLSQVLVSVGILCTGLYVVSSIPFTNPMLVAEFTYLLCAEVQLVLYCFFGNRISFSAEDLPQAVYELDWLSSSRSFKKSMLIIMTRTGRPLSLTIGKFSSLTISTFVWIGRASYSIFAVLKSGA